ncbi:MAG: hypothetical protein R3B49_10730 [Phycisphaerales bacterium]
METPRSNGQGYTRRDALQMSAAGLGALAAMGMTRGVRAAPTCATTGSATEGPYWVDEMLLRSDIRSDPSTGVVKPGLPMRMVINVSEYSSSGCTPVSGCYVDVWHCDASGVYSDVNAGGNGNTLGQQFLRGYQVTDAHGNARFLTIYPGWYSGRAVHIHYRIRKFNASGGTTFNFVSQLAFDDSVTSGIFTRVAPYTTRPNPDTTFTTDNILTSQMKLRLSDNGDHAVASFNAVINAVSGTPITLNGQEMDEDSLDHLNDFGGGTPRFAIA